MAYVPESRWGFWPGPLCTPMLCPQPSSDHLFSVLYMLFFFLSVLYILVIPNSILISTFPANAQLEDISLGAGSFWPCVLYYPHTWEAYTIL